MTTLKSFDQLNPKQFEKPGWKVLDEAWNAIRFTPQTPHQDVWPFINIYRMLKASLERNKKLTMAKRNPYVRAAMWLVMP